MAEETYSEDEAQQILQMAARGPLSSGAVSESKLVEIAAELGIPAEDVRSARRQFELDRTERADRLVFRRKLRREFACEFSRWFSASVFLLGLNFITTGMNLRAVQTYWAWWPIGFWGLAILSKGYEAVSGLTFNFESRFQTWRAKKLEKEAKAAQRATPVSMAAESRGETVSVRGG